MEKDRKYDERRGRGGKLEGMKKRMDGRKEGRKKERVVGRKD